MLALTLFLAAAPLDFTLVTEVNREGHKTLTTLHVKGASVHSEITDIGPNPDPPTLQNGVLDNGTEVDKLLATFSKAKTAQPKSPLPAKREGVPYTRYCFHYGTAKPRCLERLVGETDGADYKAFWALFMAVQMNLGASAL